MKTPHLLMQSAIRASAMVVVKLLGLIGRVILTRLVGAEGIGLYQMGYSLYGFVIMLTGGLPTALAIVTAKQPKLGWRLLKIVSISVIFFSGMISLIVFWKSTPIARLLGNSELNYILRSLAPAILAAPLLGLLRGYLQGLEQFSIIAASEVIEQASRIFFLLLITYYWLPSGIERAIGKGVYATFLSVIITFLILTIYVSLLRDKSFRPQNDAGSLPILWFFRTSLMISLTRLLIPASEFIDAILIPNRLISAGYSPSEATAVFGIITGMATTIVYTPTLVTEALSHTMTMRIAAHWQHGNLQKYNLLTQVSLKISWLWGLVSSAFLFVYAKDLSLFIFNTDEAYLPIKYMAVIPLIVGFREISTSILWSQDIKKIPLYGLVTGICCSILVQYILIGIPGYGFIGAAAGIVTMEAIPTAWNIRAITIKKAGLYKLFRTMLLDVIVICGMMLLTFQSVDFIFGNAAAFTRFLAGGGLFFLTSGCYMFLRYKNI